MDLLKSGTVVSHTKLGYGAGAKSIVNANQLVGRYPGDSDRGRDGESVNAKNVYTDLLVSCDCSLIGNILWTEHRR